MHHPISPLRQISVMASVGHLTFWELMRLRRRMRVVRTRKSAGLTGIEYFEQCARLGKEDVYSDDTYLPQLLIAFL